MICLGIKGSLYILPYFLYVTTRVTNNSKDIYTNNAAMFSSKCETLIYM